MPRGKKGGSRSTSFEAKIKNLFWKRFDLIYPLLLIIFFIVIHTKIVGPLVSLPGPIYGGDYYYQLGQTAHVEAGGSALESSTIPGSLPGYFVLYSFLSGNIAKLPGVDAIEAQYALSLIIVILSLLIVYTLGQRLYGSPLLSICLALLYVTPQRFPLIKYTEFAYFVMIPLAILMMYNFVHDQSVKNQILLGITYGLVGLTHSVAFIGVSILFGTLYLYYVIIGPKVWKNFSFKSWLQASLPFWVALGIGLLIAMLYWFDPLFVYHAKTSLHYEDWANLNWSPLGNQFKFLWTTMKSVLFSFSTLGATLFSILTYLAILATIFQRKVSEQTKFVFVILAGGFIATFHFFLTENLLGTTFIPYYQYVLILKPALLLFMLYGIFFGAYIYARFLPKVEYFYLVLIALLLVLTIMGYNNRINEQWYDTGKTPVIPQYAQVSAYLQDNSDVNDVILTTKELGFALNGVSGRKLVVVRRAQNDPFLEMDQREIDAGIMLYGDDNSVRERLLKQYDVKYLYWDMFWVNSEFRFQDGQLASWFDPLIAFQAPEYEEQLKASNVSYFVQNTWVDPTLRGPEYKTFDLIFISPQNYRNLTHPWDPTLDSYLQEVWSHTNAGVKIAALYKVVSQS